MNATSILISSLAWALVSLPAWSNQQQTQTPNRCEESVVTKTGYYFEDQPDSGSYVMFKSKLGVTQFEDVTAGVVDRTASPKSVLATQKVGDRVRVCLISYPEKDQYCNPDRDPRGRYYRVYNYRQKATYSGTNGNHLCGGA